MERSFINDINQTYKSLTLLGDIKGIMPHTNGEPIVLVVGSDNSYSRPTAVTLYLALLNIDDSISVVVYVIDNGVSRINRKKIGRIVYNNSNCHVIWKSVEGIIDSLPVTSERLTVNAYIPLFIPEILPNRYSRALFLDSDLIVEDDISKIWYQSLNNSLLAVRDFWIPCVSSKDGLANYFELGIDGDHPYFNSGVMLINLKAWRCGNVRERSLAYLRDKSESVILVDQGVLNAVLAGEWSPLDLKWNVHHALDSRGWENAAESWSDLSFRRQLSSRAAELLEHPGILHFAGPDKPWKNPHSHPEGLRWFRYLWSSGWQTKTERLQSMAHFFSRRAVKALRVWTRPHRHWLVRHLPGTHQYLLKPDAD